MGDGNRSHSDGGSRNHSTVLVCTAPYLRGMQGDSRYGGRVHGVRLQVVPFTAKPTYRKVDDWCDARPGHLVVRCSSCGAFSEYAIEDDSPPKRESKKTLRLRDVKGEDRTLSYSVDSGANIPG